MMSRIRWGQLLPLTVAVCLCLAIDAPGAEAPAEPVEPPVSDSPGPAADDSLISQIFGGGITNMAFMVTLGLFSLAATTIALERAVNTRRRKLVPGEFVAELQRLNRAHESRPEPYRLLCSEHAAPIATTLSAGLLRAGRPVPEVEKAMEDTAAREMAALRGSIRPLNVLANVATLVGLQGTVVGMIFSFRTASQTGLGKGEAMAEGIYMALFTTAAGLTIAIPSLLAAAWLTSRVEKAFREIDQHVSETMPSFARMDKMVGERV